MNQKMNKPSIKERERKQVFQEIKICKKINYKYVLFKKNEYIKII